VVGSVGYTTKQTAHALEPVGSCGGEGRKALEMYKNNVGWLELWDTQPSRQLVYLGLWAVVGEKGVSL